MKGLTLSSNPQGMQIIGKLLKKTTEINYRRNFNKGKEYVNQLKTLEKLIYRSKNTNFGKRFGFEEILQQDELVEDSH